MKEKDLYTPEQMEKINKLRQEAEAERKTKKELLENNKRFSYNDIFSVGDKVFYKGKRGVITERNKDNSNKTKVSFLYTIKCGVEVFENITVHQFGKREVQNYDHVEVCEKVKKTSTRNLLAWYRRIAYGPYWSEDYYGEPDNLELQLKAELSRREHVPNKKEGKVYRRKNQSK